MKRYLKMQKSAAALVILFLILVLSLPAYAATQKEKITSVKLTVAYDSKPEAGEDIGSVTVTLADERIEISDPATYYDPEDTVWIRGEIPVIQLELSVKDTDKYRFTTSTNLRLRQPAKIQEGSGQRRQPSGADQIEKSHRPPGGDR